MPVLPPGDAADWVSTALGLLAIVAAFAMAWILIRSLVRGKWED